MKMNAFWILPLAASMAAAQAPASADKSLSGQLAEARQQLAEQSALLSQMREELARQSGAIEQLRVQQNALRAVTLTGSIDDAPRLQNAVLLLRGGAPFTPAALVSRPQASEKASSAGPADLFLRIGSARLTPGGWVDFTSIYRSTNLGSGLGTTLQSIPFNNTTLGGLSELRFTAQGSRLSIRLDENIGKTRVFGYLETDFNGYLAGNGDVSTNSDSLRLRAIYANIARGKWEMLGGQQWSLLTPTRKTLSPYIADLFVPAFIDTSYQAGLTYTRQEQIRAVYHATPGVAIAISLENPQQFSGSAVIFPTLFTNTEVDINSSTGSGGATATPNLHPDVISRATFDHTVAGLPWHGSLAGLLTSSRVETPASVTKTVAVKDNREGGGIAGNINLGLFKGFNLLSTGFWSDGGARYIGGTGPGVVVLQNGSATAPFSAALIHSGSGIGGFEWTVRNTTVTALGSAIYFQRRYGLDPDIKTATYVGYGFPGSANTNNRVIKEYSLSTTTTLWKSPNYGALLLINQSSYVWRAPWYVAAGSPKDAHVMVDFLNLRYVLP
jgi:hypothetical protein